MQQIYIPQSKGGVRFVLVLNLTINIYMFVLLPTQHICIIALRLLVVNKKWGGCLPTPLQRTVLPSLLASNI